MRGTRYKIRGVVCAARTVFDLTGCCCLLMRRDRALQSPSMGFALTGQPFGLFPIARKQVGKIGLKMRIYSLYVATGILPYVQDERYVAGAGAARPNAV